MFHRFADDPATAPLKLKDELGWAENLTLPEVTLALMQALDFIHQQDQAIANMEARLRSIEEKLIPDDDRDEDPATF